MDFNFKLRLLGYYQFKNQKMNPEELRVEDAQQLAPLLSASLDSILTNPQADEFIKKAIAGNAVFIFKDEAGQLYAFHTTSKNAKLTSVRYSKDIINVVPLKYKRWFVPGNPIILIFEDTAKAQSTSESIPQGETNSSHTRNSSKRVFRPQQLPAHEKEYSEETKAMLEEWMLEEAIGVGYFRWLDDGNYEISDFRNCRFRSLRYPEYDEDDDRGKIVIIENVSQKPINTLYKSNTYYQFAWRIEKCDNELGYKVSLETPAKFKKIQPKELIENLNSIWKDPDAADDMSDVMKMVTAELMASSAGTFIYELLQNANDNAIGANDELQQKQIVPVDVEFHITDNYLICRHTGDYFSPRDIAGVCKVAKGSKRFRKNAIGYKGIGFKTVFHSHNWVGIVSGDYSFFFKERRNRPWQIMPIWCNPTDIPEEVKSVIEKNKEDFRVITIMKPKDVSILREDKKCHHKMLTEMFKDVRDIIFIPNIRSVRAYDNGICIAKCQYDSNTNWVKSDLKPFDIRPNEDTPEGEDIQSKINREIALYGKERGIPGKYKDFGETTVAFACMCAGNTLKEVKDATVNCYLPTIAQWGFPFLMNTDMVPSGDRNRLKLDVEFNASFAYIAGVKFVEWIVQLLEAGYDRASVFDLVPNFDACRRGVGHEYEKFITQFENGFKEKSKELAFVPTENADGSITLRKLDEVLIDETGLMSSSVMSAQEFYQVTGISDKFLLAMDLRKHRVFTKHSQDDKDFSYIQLSLCTNFSSSDLVQAVLRPDFQNWLKVANQNNSWLNFLRTYVHSSTLQNCPMFMTNNVDNLYVASQVVFDKNSLSDILFLESHLVYLNEASRDILKDDSLSLFSSFEKWFCDFDAAAFVKKMYADHKEELLTAINVPENNYKWHHFLMTNRLSPDKSFTPVIISDSNPVLLSAYTQIFFSSSKATEFTRITWIDQSKLAILSDKYAEEMEDYFKKLGVKEASEANLLSVFVATNDSIVRELTKAKVRSSLQNSIDFVSYIFANNTALAENVTLKDYPLAVADHMDTPDDMWRCPDTDQLYWDDNAYQTAIQHSWIKKEWMYALCSDYLKGTEEEIKAKKSFFKRVFGVGDISKESFYLHVVKGKDAKHLPEIFSAISGNEKDNIDYIQYLADNYELIFELKRDGELIKKYFHVWDEIAVEAAEGITCARTYQYSVDAVSLCKESWIPAGLIKVASQSYTQLDGEVYAKLMPQLGVYAISLDDVCTNLLSGVALSSITTFMDLKSNVACHSYLIAHMSQVAPNKLSALKLPIYLEGTNNTPVKCSNAGGHLLLDQKLLTLLNKILPIEQLNMLYQGYPVNDEYWVKLLKNERLGINDVFSLNDSPEGLSLALTKLRSSIHVAMESDKELNILLWRELKKIGRVGKNMKNLLPILCYKSSSEENVEKAPSLHSFTKAIPCYIGNAYFGNVSGNEDILNEYASGSYIVAEEYMEDESSPEQVKEWFDYWKQVGCSPEAWDIIRDSVIVKNLVNIKKPQLANVLANYNKQIFNEKEDLLPYLQKIWVLTNDPHTPYHTLPNCKIINLVTEAPFKDVLLDKEIAAIHTKEAKELLIFIAQSMENNTVKPIVSTRKDWMELKIAQYVNWQSSSEPDVSQKAKSCHLAVIKELCEEYVKDYRIWESSQSIPKLKLQRAEDESFALASVLRLGSSYKPDCDMQAHGVGVSYVSDVYASIDKIDTFFKAVLKVRHQFESIDIPKLKDNHNFAVYFWSEYIRKVANLSRVEKLIADQKFTSTTCCVPTDNNEVKSAFSLYHRARLAQKSDKNGTASDFLSYVEDGANKTMSQLIPSKFKVNGEEKDNPIFGLGFKDKLDIKDCFSYLANSDVKWYEKRRRVLSWLIDYNKSNATIVSHALSEYMSSGRAKWVNGEGQVCDLSELYTILPDPKNAVILSHFNSDAHIIAKQCFEDNKHEEMCRVLGMSSRILSDSDFEPIPNGTQSPQTEYCQKQLIYRCLIISAVVDYNRNGDWKSAYNRYVEAVRQCYFISCDSISLCCKKVPDIKKDEAVLFYEKDKTFYYVDKWQSKPIFSDLVETCIRLLSIPDGDKMTISRLLDVEFDGRQLMKFMSERCGVLLEDIDFREEIKKCNLSLYSMLPDLTQVTNEESYSTVVSIFGNDTIVEVADGVSEEHVDSHVEIESVTAIESEGLQDELASAENAQSLKSATEVHQNSTNLIVPEIYVEPKQEPSGSTRKDSISETSVQFTNSDSSRKVSSKVNRARPPFDFDDIADESGYVDNGDNDDDNWDYTAQYKVNRNSYQSNLTDFKDKEVQAELKVADLDSEEGEKIKSYIGSAKSEKEIVDEHYLVRYRLYNALVSQGVSGIGSEEEFVRNGKRNILSSNGYIYARSAKGGILFLSSFLWNKLITREGQICIYYGNKAYDFVLIKTVDQLIEYVGRDNIVVQVAGKNKVDTITAVFSGSLDAVQAKAHVLIRLKSNERYNSIFVSTFVTDDQNDVNF